jgi:hypothetical protein
LAGKEAEGSQIVLGVGKDRQMPVEVYCTLFSLLLAFWGTVGNSK